MKDNECQDIFHSKPLSKHNLISYPPRHRKSLRTSGNSLKTHYMKWQYKGLEIKNKLRYIYYRRTKGL